MPTNIWACVQSDGVNHWVGQYPVWGGSTEYTLVHNNPEYHVVPKSDVHGDVMGRIDRCINLVKDGYLACLVKEDMHIIRNALIAQSKPPIVDGDVRFCFEKDTFFMVDKKSFHEMNNALIAQSDPDIVRIPRKVLEGMLVELDEEECDSIYCDLNYECDKARNQVINNVLNYKEN